MNSVICTTNEYRDRTRVEIENLVPWSVSFETRTIPGSRFEGVVIPGSSYNDDGTYHASFYRQLNLEEVLTQISMENVAFCGVDGRGAHACFRFCDLELYKVAFDLPDAKELPLQLTHEEIEKLLKITDEKKFRAKLDELVVTESEKFHLAIAVANHKNFDDFSFRILKIIEEKTGRKLNQ